MTVAQTTFTVEGYGAFPLDMLRYDSAWPVDTSDAREIEASIAVEGAGRWTVRLNSADRHAPTIGRWESFNCRVSA